MIQLDSKNIKIATRQRLEYLQNEIDSKATFLEKKEKAASLWNNKSGSEINREAFNDVKLRLREMCVSVEICNYCEQSKANDIEHIAPKSFFPEKAFVWDNYLLACKQCNTGLKLDKCHVLDNQGNVHDTIRGQEPIFKTHAFINPRIENPNDFLIMNMLVFQFVLKPNLSTADRNKAEKTLEILQLNNDSTLIHTRRQAAKYFYQRMELLVRILKSQTKKEIDENLDPYTNPYHNSRRSINYIKGRIKGSFKEDIQTHSHPSVWYAIKMIENKINVKWQQLFNDLPEALHW